LRRRAAAGPRVRPTSGEFCLRAPQATACQLAPRLACCRPRRAVVVPARASNRSRPEPDSTRSRDGRRTAAVTRPCHPTCRGSLTLGFRLTRGRAPSWPPPRGPAPPSGLPPPPTCGPTLAVAPRRRGSCAFGTAPGIVRLRDCPTRPRAISGLLETSGHALGTWLNFSSLRKPQAGAPGPSFLEAFLEYLTFLLGPSRRLVGRRTQGSCASWTALRRNRRPSSQGIVRLRDCPGDRAPSGLPHEPSS